MSTSIKIGEKAKRLLDTIQARITLATGRKYSQQELLDMIIESSDDYKEDIIRRLTSVKALSTEEIDHILHEGTRKKPALANIVGLGKSGSDGNAVTLKKRIQKGEI